MQRPPASAPLVALIDEDVWLVRQLSEDLQKLGYRVLGWTSPTFAAELLATTKCDVIVTEGVMSTLKGSELIAQANEKYGADRPGYVLHSTSPKKLSRKDRALFDVTVAKPCSPEDLVVAIKSAMEASRSAKAESAPVIESAPIAAAADAE
ncbi:MAG: hypothetical protein M3Y87_07170 [Myxococcota bacterium]|nr:hypothetical protein [Myxococcota bacterium]